MNVVIAVQRWLRSRMVAEDAFTLPEVLMVIVISSLIASVMAAALTVGVHTRVATESRLDESHDAQMASAFFSSDAASAQSFSTAAPGPLSCANGLTNVAQFSWTDSTGAHDAFYATTGSPAVLIRRTCLNNVLESEVKLAKHLASMPTVTCPAPATACSSTPLDVMLSVQETSSYQYTLRGVPRMGSSTGSSGLPSFAVYVGGPLVLGGSHSKIQQTGTPGAVYVDGNATCNGGGAGNITGPLTVLGSSDCGGSSGAPLADPLRNLSAPSPIPTNAAAPSNSNQCHPGEKTYWPGRYPVATTVAPTGGAAHACLASGIYWFDNGADISQIETATGGVLIYVAGGDLSVNSGNHPGEETTLSSMTSGTYRGIGIFMGRTNSGTINVNSSVTIDGVIYAPAGTLNLQSNNANIVSGPVDVFKLQYGGNGGSVTVTA